MTDTRRGGNPMFICAAWRRWLEGIRGKQRTFVTRCDLGDGHTGDHLDNVLLINWPESESDPECRPRNEGDAVPKESS